MVNSSLIKTEWLCITSFILGQVYLGTLILCMDYACVLISSVHINWLHCAVVWPLVYTSQLIISGYTNSILLRICVLCDIQVQLQQLTNLDICVKEIFMVCQLLLHMAIATCMHVYVYSYIAVTIVLPNYTVNSLISYIANNQLTIELHTLITCQPYMSLCYYYSMFLCSLEQLEALHQCLMHALFLNLHSYFYQSSQLVGQITIV